MTKKLLILSLLVLALFACTNPANTDQAASSVETNMNTVATEQADSVQDLSEQLAPVIIETEAEAEPAKSAPTTDKPTATAHTTTSSSSPAYSSYDKVEEESDYWEEQRKHSPNDNYLMGFDEDVDDVHDMEIYMEDY